jgi:hypothetical protein
MPAHKAPFDLHSTYLQYPDPGNAGTVTADRNLLYCSLVSAGAETRTLARPTVEGVFATLYFKTDGGDITLTVTGGYNAAGDTSITLNEAGQALQFVSFYTGSAYAWRLVYSDAAGGGVLAAETVAATNTITAAELRVPGGKTFFLSHATEFDSVLPAPELGLRATFIVADAPESANYTISTGGSSNVILGQIYTVDVDSATNPEFVTAGVDTVTVVAAKAVVGDRVDFVSDGTNWFAYGFCSVFDALTFDTAS